MDANGTMLRIARVGEFTPFPFTILGWEVADIDATVAAMTSKGVQFCLYSFLQQAANGSVDCSGRGRQSCLVPDPDGNTLSISQH